MKSKYITWVIATLCVVSLKSFGQQRLDDGKTVYFGQSIEAAQKLFGVAPIDDPSPVARKGIDRKINADDVSLTFDTGKLDSIEFKQGYQFRNPPAPYPEKWKNLVPIGDARIKAGMTHAEFMAYLKAWEKRANKLGARKVVSEDLATNEYSISVTRESYMDSVDVSTGPSRKTGRGGRWNDGWNAFFATRLDHELRGVPVGSLQSLSAFCDKFNTVAR